MDAFAPVAKARAGSHGQNDRLANDIHTASSWHRDCADGSRSNNNNATWPRTRPERDSTWTDHQERLRHT